MQPNATKCNTCCIAHFRCNSRYANDLAAAQPGCMQPKTTKRPVWAFEIALNPKRDKYFHAMQPKCNTLHAHATQTPRTFLFVWLRAPCGSNPFGILVSGFGFRFRHLRL
jgi:hypothetical protein